MKNWKSRLVAIEGNDDMQLRISPGQRLDFKSLTQLKDALNITIKRKGFTVSCSQCDFKVDY